MPTKPANGVERKEHQAKMCNHLLFFLDHRQKLVFGDALRPVFLGSHSFSRCEVGIIDDEIIERRSTFDRAAVVFDHLDKLLSPALHCSGEEERLALETAFFALDRNTERQKLSDQCLVLDEAIKQFVCLDGTNLVDV